MNFPRSVEVISHRATALPPAAMSPRSTVSDGETAAAPTWAPMILNAMIKPAAFSMICGWPEVMRMLPAAPYPALLTKSPSENGTGASTSVVNGLSL